jgi:hypothetical protein
MPPITPVSDTQARAKLLGVAFRASFAFATIVTSG